MVSLQSDDGQEYCSFVISKFCQQHGILHQTSCVDNPQQNGVVRSKNRHLLDIAYTNMCHMNVLLALGEILSLLHVIL